MSSFPRPHPRCAQTSLRCPTSLDVYVCVWVGGGGCSCFISLQVCNLSTSILPNSISEHFRIPFLIFLSMVTQADHRAATRGYLCGCLCFRVLFLLSTIGYEVCIPITQMPTLGMWGKGELDSGIKGYQACSDVGTRKLT